MTISSELEAHIVRLYHVEKWRCGTVTFRNRCDESYCGAGLCPLDFVNSCDGFSLNRCDGPARISK